MTGPLTSWLAIPPTSPFSLSNLPMGIISTASHPTPRPAVAIGTFALDLSLLASSPAFSSLPPILPHLSVFHQPTLNAFAALGRPLHRSFRLYLQQLLSSTTPFPSLLRDSATLRSAALIPLDAATVTHHLPLAIGDYTDFYAGLNHAYSVGVLFRGPENALQKNYRHLPVAYHGRASSVVVSGTPVRRPRGQVVGVGAEGPRFATCAKLDYELEVAAFVCRGNELGRPVRMDEAAEYVFGYVLMNDWSARDVQAWEYVPLGPFNGKNFGTTVGAWVVLADALEPFRTANLMGGSEEALLPFLWGGRPERAGLDVELTVEIRTEKGTRTRVGRSNLKYLLYSTEQMIAHHTVGGCNLNVGDLLGSGTISGTTKEEAGSLLEVSENGKTPFTLADGETRTFLEDGDEVIMSGLAGEEGAYVGFGECRGVVLPALSIE